MIQFKKLRLSGFKSFVDRTELDIEPGLTGIVGPNGCGKSNLVEAMRWVMGENSAKRMRGEGMDDVIFAGTSGRPARSLAEVSLLLDNSSKNAPPQYHSCEEIEVTRKISREQGSTYRINGRVVRAQDVQVLFADILSGSNSPALVSQGQITRLISSRPVERRLLLEESAGIGGLYARRHEAELRLKAADSNLLRLDDITGSMEKRLAELKKQVRQASRYRNVSSQIRQMEVTVAWLEWRTLKEKLAKAISDLGGIESAVAVRTLNVVHLTKAQNEVTRVLPELRQEDAAASAKLQNLRLALQRMEDEVRQVETLLADTSSQLQQARNDRQHEIQTQEDNARQLARMDDEQKLILTSQDKEAAELEEKQKIRDELEARVNQMEEVYSTMMEKAAYLRAGKENVSLQLKQHTAQFENVENRKVQTERLLADKQQELKTGNNPDELSRQISECEALLNNNKKMQDKLQTDIEELRIEHASSQSALAEAEKVKANILTEINTIQGFLELGNDDSFRQVLDDIAVIEGFETALSKSLGDALSASIDPAAPKVWQDPSEVVLPPLPKGCKSLAETIKSTPECLKPAMLMVGVIDDASDGETLRKSLQPGQSLVSRDGALWRWDGLHVKASSIDGNAIRLQQKNRLAELNHKIPSIEASLIKAKELHDQNSQSLDDSTSRLRSEKLEAEKLESSITRLRRDLEKAIHQRSISEKELARLTEALENHKAEKQRLSGLVSQSREELARLEKEGVEDKYEKIESIKSSLLETRDSLRSTIRSCDLGKQRQETRKARLHALADERVNLQNRTIRSREWVKTLEERETTLVARLEELQGRPQEIRKGHQELLELIAEAQTRRDRLSRDLAQKEDEAGQVAKQLRKAENDLAAIREERASVQATVSAGNQRLEEIRASIEAKFEMQPQDLAAHTGLETEKISDKDIEDLRERRERLVRERESIGPVNLRAETEANELESELAKLVSERNDLLQAIAELREGIRKLNAEARERLLAAFEHVNSHFGGLFSRLFNGGNAHLSLIDAEDPLEAGLEVFVQPPGKTLQSISLMSGGEQALASAAMVFAMFLTNPSPICVLDEIDAPLDDANVDRLCDLLEEIAEAGKTRFLVITHHRLTMARMDRLYGVTMAEKGISQLVSVDLQGSFEFLEAAE